MKIETCLAIAPYLKDWYAQEVSVMVIDREKVLYIHNTEEMKNIPIVVGQPLSEIEKTVSVQALRAGCRLVVRNDKSVLGTPYIAIANPIEDDGNIVGVVSIIISTQQSDFLVSTGEEILATMEEISANLAVLSSASQQLAATSRDMDQDATRYKTDLARISGITQAIKQISAQSNILGINASIEAARAGALGRGFAVVAGEVRKLAQGTKESVDNIEMSVNAVLASVGTLLEAMAQLTVIAETQASGLRELQEAIRQTTTEAEKLVKIGKSL